MARPRIVEKDYYQFQQALRRAVDSGKRIDRSETGRWKEWVKKHRVKEASFKSFGKGMYDGLESVIIDQDDEWGGYYLYSKAEEVVLTWVREGD
jgi:phosphopantetheinyl transferase